MQNPFKKLYGLPHKKSNNKNSKGKNKNSVYSKS